MSGLYIASLVETIEVSNSGIPRTNGKLMLILWDCDLTNIT